MSHFLRYIHIYIYKSKFILPPYGLQGKDMHFFLLRHECVSVLAIQLVSHQPVHVILSEHHYLLPFAWHQTGAVVPTLFPAATRKDARVSAVNSPRSSTRLVYSFLSFFLFLHSLRAS